jgi:hypothetical protein
VFADATSNFLPRIRATLNNFLSVLGVPPEIVFFIQENDHWANSLEKWTFLMMDVGGAVPGKLSAGPVVLSSGKSGKTGKNQEEKKKTGEKKKEQKQKTGEKKKTAENKKTAEKTRKEVQTAEEKALTVLGLPHSEPFTMDDVKKQFKKKCLETHPDKNTEKFLQETDKGCLFREVTEARDLIEGHLREGGYEEIKKLIRTGPAVVTSDEEPTDEEEPVDEPVGKKEEILHLVAVPRIELVQAYRQKERSYDPNMLQRGVGLGHSRTFRLPPSTQKSPSASPPELVFAAVGFRRNPIAPTVGDSYSIWVEKGDWVDSKKCPALDQALVVSSADTTEPQSERRVRVLCPECVPQTWVMFEDKMKVLQLEDGRFRELEEVGKDDKGNVIFQVGQLVGNEVEDHEGEDPPGRPSPFASFLGTARDMVLGYAAAAVVAELLKPSCY